MKEQLDAWNAPDEVREQYLTGAIEVEPFKVLKSNWKALTLFLASSTQWRTAGMAGAYIGLDYTAMNIVAKAIGVKINRNVLWGISIVEAEAISSINDKIKA